MPLRDSEYAPSFPKARITYTNCYNLTGFTFGRLLSIGGVKGMLPTHKLLWNNVEGRYPCAKIKMVFSKNVVLRREINIKTKILENKLFRSKVRGGGLGRKVFSAQLRALQGSGLERIQVVAHAEPSEYGLILEEKKWFGYLTWARFGFSMLPFYHQKFVTEILIKYNLNPDLTVFYLCMIEPNKNHPNPHLRNGGKALWANEGFLWIGFFDLTSGSENFLNFSRYLQSTSRS